MKMFITGGAGFIGCNCTKHFLDKGHQVVVFDNLSRKGAHFNLSWLKQSKGFQFIEGDIRDEKLLHRYFLENMDVDAVFHLAAQTAVTTSILNPREDFDINAFGTLNLLEAIRRSNSNPMIVYSSTNKVYGSLDYLNIIEKPKCYEIEAFKEGISENFQLDFHTPYGCSKGAAEQYMRDYHRIYGLKTVVFRQSCVYGPRQFGVEDQGWVAWFIISALFGKPITIYGDGKQVRDVLYIDDLIAAYLSALSRVDIAGGQIYNIGGGAKNQLSLLQLIEMIRRCSDLPVEYRLASWRSGDQKIFVSDNAKLKHELGWYPEEDLNEGCLKLFQWARKNRSLLRPTAAKSKGD